MSSCCFPRQIRLSTGLFRKQSGFVPHFLTMQLLAKWYADTMTADDEGNLPGE